MIYQRLYTSGEDLPILALDDASTLVESTTLQPVYLKYITDLSMININENKLPARETANCYVIKKIGRYKFPLIYGCGIVDGQENPTAYTRVSGNIGNTQPFYNADNQQITSPYIETDLGRNAVSAEVLYDDVPDFSLSDFQFVTEDGIRFLKFTVKSIPALGGNVMLGIKDSNGEVMWSWHLWAYPFEFKTCRHNNGVKNYDFLDVNLGWVKNSLTDKYGTSPYYQWGRKDPMLRPAVYSADTQATVSHGSWSVTTYANSLGETIKNPNKFNKTINDTSINYNWWANNGSTVNFFNYWDADNNQTGTENEPTIKTIYDPCPVGFTVPGGRAFVGFTRETGGVWNYGYTWNGRYFSATGCRNFLNGDISNVSLYGHCWSSAAGSTTYAYHLYFRSIIMDPIYLGTRALGFSVAPCSSSVLL